MFCEDGSSVRCTIVAGRVVYEDGRVTTVDEKAIRAEARALMAGYRETLARAGREADRLAPYYRDDVPAGRGPRRRPAPPAALISHSNLRQKEMP